MSWVCLYCLSRVEWGPGVMIIESDGETITVHEECYQQSGDDEGYVERLHRSLDDKEF